MIKSFKCLETENLFQRQKVRRLPPGLLRPALRKLWILDAAGALEDLRSPPGNRLDALKGDRSGQHSVRINEQYRSCFVWRGNDAYDVEIVDYH
ncbi:MAG: type II toxin-antitoxin system RelE/ParE family toxin [Deltaproteobacteria bacterium]|nr:MAG: type II toxin-antitoxin system RelE/ParE family toxin [Deltaproteobacteria bacterium]